MAMSRTHFCKRRIACSSKTVWACHGSTGPLSRYCYIHGLTLAKPNSAKGTDSVVNGIAEPTMQRHYTHAVVISIAEPFIQFPDLTFV